MLRAMVEDYSRSGIKVQSREDLLAKYYAKYPDVKNWVEGHIANGTCGAAARALKRDWLQRLRSKSAPNKASATSSEFQWMDAFRAKPSDFSSTRFDDERPSSRASPSVVPNVRKRGPKPNKRERVKEAMRQNIRQNRQTEAGLNAMGEEDLAYTYGVSRDTARKARAEVLLEFPENSNSDK